MPIAHPCETRYIALDVSEAMFSPPAHTRDEAIQSLYEMMGFDGDDSYTATIVIIEAEGLRASLLALRRHQLRRRLPPPAELPAEHKRTPRRRAGGRHRRIAAHELAAPVHRHNNRQERTTAMSKKDDKPNPEVKDNGDGTKTLTYRETEEQKRVREASEKAQGKGGKSSS